MKTKICSKCKQAKPVLVFNSEPRCKSGLRADCKPCQYAVQSKRYYAEHFKSAAKERAREAYNRGDITKPVICEHCKEDKELDRHHPNYSRPLEVVWLCRQCHCKLHRSISPASKALMACLGAS